MAIPRSFQIYPKQASVKRQQANKRVTIPAPIGGWNTRDDPSSMPIQDALELINMIPRQGYCEMRGGYASHSTGVGSGNVDLVTEYYNGINRQLISASPTNIYNSTAAGAATSLGSGFTNGRWDVAMMNGIMGFVNGDDAPQKYDGTTLSAMTVSGSGLTTTDLVGVHVFKSRSYFWESENQSFWYSAVNALGGTLTEFQLGNIAKRGGKLLRMDSWTVDGGSGADDFAVFIMDTGEVIVYQGDDPGSALYWGLVGIYDVGEIVNDRAILSVGGALLAVGESDVITMPQAFKEETPPVTKLSGAIAAAVKSLSGNNGWELFVYPNEDLLIVNVPVGLSPDRFDQYVLNLQTLAGCRFTDLPARTWGIYNGGAYFGSTDGVVYRFNNSESDAGSDIDVTAKMAWTDLGAAENKQITSLRPSFSADDNINVGIGVSYDFIETAVGSPSSTVAGGAPWGSAWGTSWGTNPSVSAIWRLATGSGSAVSLTLRFSRQGDNPKWYKTDSLVKLEGNL